MRASLWHCDCKSDIATVFRAFAHLAVVLLLVAALVSTACLGCVPVKAGGCCDPAGHCKKITKTCNDPHVALLDSTPPPVVMPVAPIFISISSAPPSVRTLVPVPTELRPPLRI